MRKLYLCLLVPVAIATAQNTPSPANPNPFSSFNKAAYSQMKIWLLASAEKMPEDSYNFKPADTVRSFGQIIGHLADAQNMFCSAATGEKNPNLKIEATKTSKADLIAALKDAFTYCDTAYDRMTDAAASETVKFFNRDMPKPVLLTVNDMHDSEHYGNLITYLRLKGIVPPSSEQSSSPQK
jgi:uncharacterized damage-inducible protein DinB